MERGIVGKGAGSSEIIEETVIMTETYCVVPIHYIFTLKIKLWKTIPGMTNIKFQ